MGLQNNHNVWIIGFIQ